MSISFQDVGEERYQADEKNEYIDPAFLFDVSPSTKLLHQEQTLDNLEDFPRMHLHSFGKNSRPASSHSEYIQPFSENRMKSNVINDMKMLSASHGEVTGMKKEHDLLNRQKEMRRQMFKDDVQLRDYLAKKAFYTTSTQRLYEGADWDERITSSQLAPKTSKEVHADPVSFRVESKLYAPNVEGWQQFGSRPFSWDYVQTRNRHCLPGPVRLGHVGSGPDEMDDKRILYHSQNRQRTMQPKYATAGRKGNIPGYTGCVLFSNYDPAGINDPEHQRSTTRLTYRSHEEFLSENNSAFKKSSPMSRMVTLTHPFNPFNKVH
ncbi:spermatogenesis-associated protein 48-like isoform X3 [Xenia sp. Carnegie-2017]|uniref:spermatogenesis-associated protein 48-like isoform X3 n=1 Tax=Xenia sp. Carnegie-2017 TaxID=2897299 RepID=UPI001F03C2A1|nr:spermatogenesis-associated protein 48-like isoform X3 [Xenia sp. Carnegie-2017]